MRDVLAIDGSNYQKRYDGRVIRAGGVELAILKTDPRFGGACQELAEGGVEVAAYTWLDPTASVESQGQATLKRISAAGVPVRFVAVDFEQWWAVWGQWYQAVAHQLAWAAVTRLASGVISRKGLELVTWLGQNSDLPVVVYTSYGFVSSYAPQAAGWLGKYPAWVSHWKKQPEKKTSLSWEEVRAGWLPDYEPLYPAGTSGQTTVGHQFSGDRILAPGIFGDEAGRKASAADLSVFDRNWWDQVRKR